MTAVILLFAMILTMMPGLTRPAEAAENRGAFGLVIEQDLTDTEKQDAINDAPFGVSEKAFPLYIRSELFWAYGWDGDESDGTNRIKVSDYTGKTGSSALNKTFSNVSNGNTKTYTYPSDNNYTAVALDSVNVGNSRDEYVAMLGYDYDSSQLKLSLVDSGGAQKSSNVQIVRYGLGEDSWFDLDAYENGGFMSVAAGDFDGDGKDSIIVYSLFNKNTSYPGGQLKEYDLTADGSLYTISETRDMIADIYTLLGFSDSDKKKLKEDLTDSDNAVNIPVMQMEATDTDRDGFDELVITAGMNAVDVDGTLDNKKLGTQVFIYDYIGGKWIQSAHFEPGSGSGSDASKANRMMWGTSTVGNVVASGDASAGSTDFPEIVTAGFLDTDGGDSVDPDSDTLVYSVIECTGMKGAESGQKNYQGTYGIYARGTLEMNGFTEGGFYDGDDISHLLQTKSFNYMGGANAEAVFISGSVYRWDSESGALTKLYTNSYLDSDDDGIGIYRISNTQVESVAAGNFDGNDEGREQLIFGTLLKQSGRNNSYSELFLYSCDDGSWSSKRTDGWYIDRHGKAYMALTDFDCDDDSTIVRYKNVEKQWSEPDVLAILEATPYFEDLGSDLGESATIFSTGESSGTGSGSSHSLLTNIMVGFEYTAPILETGGGFELTIENNFTWSTNETRTMEYSIEYSNNTTENQVVVYRMPSLLYTYEDVNTGENIYVSKNLTPATAMISVNDYNAEASRYNLDPIDESKLCTPGDPESYPKTVTQISNTGGKNIVTSTYGYSQYSTNGHIAKSIDTSTSQESEFNYELSTSFTAYGIAFGAKAGGGAGYAYGYEATTINANNIDRVGDVEGKQVDGYDFQWNFAYWNVSMKDKTVPVLGYLVQNVEAPPSPARNLSVTDIETDSLTLQWESGARSAEEYRIYRLRDTTYAPYVLMGTVSGTETQFRVENLVPDTSYTFVVRGSSGGQESVDSISVTAATAQDGVKYVNINPLEDASAAPGGTAIFSTTVTPGFGTNINNLNLIWQKRDPGAGTWRDIDSSGTGTLKVSDVTQDMDGTQYRLMVVAITNNANDAYYYSNTATLHVNTTPVQISGFTVGASEESSSPVTGGSGTLESPYLGIANWTKENRNMTTTDVEVIPSFSGSGDTAGVSGSVYTVSGSDPAVFVGLSDSESGEEYYSLSESGGSYTAVSRISPEILYTDSEGQEFRMPEEFNGDQITENGYTAFAEWEESADSVSAPRILWEKDKRYYTAADGDYTEVPDAAPEYLLCYQQGDVTILLGDSDYFVLTETSDGGSDTVLTVKRVSAVEKITIGDASYDTDTLVPYTVTAQEQVTDVTTEAQQGTVLELSASVSAAGAAQSGLLADFIITNQNTGEVQSISVHSDASGKISTRWTAPSGGLYSIQISVSGGESLSGSRSDLIYYYAEVTEKDGTTPDQYRLLLKSNSGAVSGSISYGNPLSFAIQRLEDGNWTSLSEASASGEDLSLFVTEPDGTEHRCDISDIYIPSSAGTYTFSVRTGTGDQAEEKTSAFLSVTPVAIVAEPVWDEHQIPVSAEDISLKITDPGGEEITLFGSDSEKLKNALSVSCPYFDDQTSAGSFTVSLAWKTEESETDGSLRETIMQLQAAYSITLKSAGFYIPEDTAVVTFTAGAGGSIEGYSGSNSFSITSGNSQMQGTRLSFQAQPDEGYRISAWKINGERVEADDSRYVITDVSGTDNQILTVESFDIAKDTSDDTKQMSVEVEFTNRISTVIFSVESTSEEDRGTLTAVTGNGTDITSGTSLAYGSSVKFTAEPAEGRMIREWHVTSGNGTSQTYVWPETDQTYRENTLTLSGLDQARYTVTVVYEDEKTFTAAAPSLAAEGTYAPVTSGEIRMTDSAGKELEAGAVLTQGKAVTYHVTLSDSSFSAVKEWQYSLNGGQSWQSVPDSTGQLSYTYYNPVFDKDGGTLSVRAVVSQAQTYSLGWSIEGLSAEDIGKASLSAKSGGTELTNGASYAVNTPVTFELTLDGSYYVTGWTNAEAEEGGTTAELTLTENTEVKVSVSKKPTVTVAEGTSSGGTVEITGTRDGTETAVTSGSYVDFGSDLKVTLRPAAGYEVSPDIDADYTDGSGTTTDDKYYTIKNVSSDQTVAPAWAPIETYSISFSVMDLNGDEEGGTNGTLEASARRKGIESYSVESLESGQRVYGGSSVTFTASPDEGYRVQEWRVNGEIPQDEPDIVVSGNILTLTDIGESRDDSDGQTEITVQFVPLGNETTVTAGIHGSVRASLGSVEFDQDTLSRGFHLEAGASIRITAEPDPGYEVDQWLINGTPAEDVSGKEYTYVSRSDSVGAAISVTFRQVTYPVIFGGEHGTVTAAGASGDLTSGDEIRGGTTVIFTAEPDDGYTVTGWTVNGERIDSAVSDILRWTVPNGLAEDPSVRSYDVEALFTRGNYEVTIVPPSGGTGIVEADISLENGVRGGTSVTFTAEPAGDYIVAGWKVNGMTEETFSRTHTVTIEGDTTVEAVIVPSHYEISWSAEGAGGTVSAEGYGTSPASVEYKGNIVLKAEPDAYWHVSQWKVDGEPVTEGVSADRNTLTLENITSAHEITVIFTGAVRFNVGYSVDSGSSTGTGGTLGASADGEKLTLTAGQTASIRGNSELIFSAEPASGSMVKEWSVSRDGENYTTVTRENMESLGVTMDHSLSETLTVKNLTSNLYVKVSFESYSGFSLPISGTGYIVTDVKRSPSDTSPDAEIRRGGDLTFTVVPDGEKKYTTISELVVCGYDCVAGKKTESGLIGCEGVTAVKNDNGGYTVTIIGVTKKLSMKVTAHRLIVTDNLDNYNIPGSIAERYPNAEAIRGALDLRLDAQLTATEENRVYYDIALKYYDSDQNAWIEVTEDNFPENGVEVVLKYPEGTDSRDHFCVVHMLTADKADGSMEAGDTEVIENVRRKSDGLSFHVDSLSPFGVSWTKYSEPVPPSGGGGGGGGGGAVSPSETVIIRDSSHGSVKADDVYAEKGDTVTLTVTPEDGYILDSLTVTGSGDDEIELTEKGKYAYTFIMPSGTVTVMASFVRAAEEPEEHICPSEVFRDLDTSAWYHEAVDYTLQEGLMNGTGPDTFEPSSTLTRGMIVTMLYRMEGEPEISENSAFDDVRSGFWYSDAIAWADENDIVNGYGDGRFAPDEAVTREQMAAVFYRYAQYKGYDVSRRGVLDTFSDRGEISGWAVTPVQWAFAEGLISGKGSGILDPSGTATRAEVAQIFLNFCEKIAETDPDDDADTADR